MTHGDKIEWMIHWCHKNKVVLELEGFCGFGRECVGILATNGCYPDYYWYNERTWENLDDNGIVWVPKNYYHKHDCVAVLGRGEKAESQLYDWLKWFDNNGFVVEVVDEYDIRDLPEFTRQELLFYNRQHARMVKRAKE